MNLNVLYLTRNDCYKAGTKLIPQGIVVHSTGANNEKLSRYVGPDDGKLGVNPNNNHWNQPRPDGRQVCVHAFIGKLKDGSVATYQTLPWDMRGWHGGSGKNGSVNNTHIGFEICEDALTDRGYFDSVYREATEFCAYLCKLHKFDPRKDGVLIDHSEGYKRGIASNHGDVKHWFTRFGKSMDIFRGDVKRLIEEGGSEVLTKMKVQVDGGKVTEIASVLKDGANYPNLRELAELLGVSVGFEAVNKVVTLNCKQKV